MQVELPVSKIKVDLIDKLGWGARQKIQAAMLGKIGVDASRKDHAEIDGEGLYRGKVKAMEICITKMTNPEGGDVKFSEAWLDVLDQEDGEVLYNAIDAIATDIKK